MANNAPREVMTEAEAADYLGVSLRTMIRLRTARAVAYARIRKSIRYRRSELDRYLNAQTMPVLRVGGDR